MAGLEAEVAGIEPDLAVHPFVKRGVELRNVHVGRSCQDLRH